MKKNSTKRALLSSVLALIVCFTMLVGTTFAWFTDNVSSENNIIKTGKLDVTMEWADGSEDPANATWTDASNGPIFEYELWEPGYAAARHIKVSNIGTLALNYQMRIVANGVVSELADVIDVYYFDEDVAMTRADLANATLLGTLKEVLGTEKNIANTIKGSIVAGGASDIHTIVFKMQETAGNEYQNMDLGCTFSVELFATQMASESDSFDNQYDAGASALQAAPPAANVGNLGKLLIRYTEGIGGDVYEDYLDAAYQFEPTMTWEEAQASDYRYWHADFVVYADHDVPANSIMLAGYYDAWCQYNNDNWVGLTADETISAGTKVRLVEGLGATVNWEELCQYGNDGTGFLCGLADMSDNGVNAGTTITVELRLYAVGEQGECNNGGGCKHPDVECELGEEDYILAGKFEYKFEAREVVGQDALDTAIAAGVSEIKLGAGEYVLPNTNGKTVEIIGTEDTVIDTTRGYYADSANLTFRGVTFKTTMDNANGGDYELLYCPNVTYIDCTFNGAHGIGRDGATYINCTFNLPVDYVWTFAHDVTFEGCTFNSQGKALLLYNHGGSEMVNVVVKDCVFNATAGAKAGAIANQNCAAIEIDNFGASFNLITSGNTVDSDFSGEWRIKSFYNNGNTVTVNDTAYSTIALDGRLMTIDADRNVTVQ